MPTVDSLDIQISTSLSNTDKMLDNLITKLGVVSSSLSSVGGTTSKVSSGMTKVVTSANKSTKSFKGLASAIGSFYANYAFVIRGIKQLNTSIQSTADYVEAFNYFEVSFNKIASEWKKDYERFGYDNAKSYAESFSKRAKESLSKLSGVQVDVDADGKGLLTETGLKNLGLNIQEITQYASQLASITNSVGQTGEVSLATANAFTKLAGDISSLFNQDYSSVAKNLQSGLIGQSRALYKYGIDITNATLQTYAYELGLEKAVSEMTQAEKMQLRMIAILDQSKVSWGDLANTINSPSNMIRQFKNNLKEAGMVLGQLFIPLLQRVLPVVNGATIAIKRLLTNIAGILGIELDLSSFGQTGTDLEDSYGGVSDSLDDVAESAKKAKAGLRGFDELKTIQTPKSSSDGLGNTIDLTNEIIAATEEYEKVWQQAYDKMEQKAQAFADNIEKYFAPVKKLFKDIAIGDWFAVGQDTSNLVSGIFDFFSDAIESVDWEQVGTNIGLFLEGVNWVDVLDSFGNLLWTAINAVIDLWKGSFNAAPIETGIITGITFLSWTGLGSAIWKGIKNSILVAVGAEKGTSLIAALVSWAWKGITGLIPALASVSTLALSASIGGIIAGIPAMIVGIYDAFKDGIDWLSGVLIPAGATAAGAGIGAIIGMLGGPIGAGVGALIGLAIGLVTDGVILIVEKWDSIKEWFSGIGEWFSTNVTKPIANFFKNLWTDVSGFFSNLRNDVVSVWKTVSEWFSTNVTKPIVNIFIGFATRVGQVFEGIWIIIQAVWIIVSEWFNENVITPISDSFTSLWEGIKSVWGTVSKWFEKNIINPVTKFFKQLGKDISAFFKNAWNKVKEVWQGVSTWFDTNIATPLGKVWEKVTTKIGNLFNTLWSGIKFGVVNAMNTVIGGIEKGINFIIAGINKIIGGFNKIVSWAAKVAEVDWGGVDLVPKVSLTRIQTYEVGGFPKSADLFWANENGVPELVGTMGGKTAVASGMEITGIKDAILQSSNRDAKLMERNNQLLSLLLEKEFGITRKEVFNIAREEAREYFYRTGNEAYSF